MTEPRPKHPPVTLRNIPPEKIHAAKMDALKQKLHLWQWMEQAIDEKLGKRKK